MKTFTIPSNAYYVKYTNAYDGLIKEKGALHKQPLNEFTIEDINEELKNGDIELIEVLTTEGKCLLDIIE